MNPPMLFYVSREDGSVTGPHPAPAIRKGIESGDFNFETSVCLSGTEDWLPIGDWIAELGIEQCGTVAASKYADILDAPGKKSAFRIFWAILGIGIGLIQCVSAIFTVGSIPFWLSIIILAIGVLWGIGGVSELMRQAKKR